MRELRDELGVDVTHAAEERDHGGDEVGEAERGDHLLEPVADLVQIRSEGGSDRIARSHLARGNQVSEWEIPGRRRFLPDERRRRLPARTSSRASELDALDDQGELRGFDHDRRQSAVGGEGGVEPSLFESLGPHRKAVTIPVHDPDSVTSFRKEDEEVPAQWVLPEHVADERHQAVGALSSVDGLGRNEQPHAWREAQHERAWLRTSRRRDRAAASNDGGTRTM